MKVELINKEEVKDLFKHWGETACQCYNTPIKFADKVGKACFKDGHYSGSRTEFFKFKIKGISRACSLQLNRHTVGVVLNQQSQRYVDMSNQSFVVPNTIFNNDQAMKEFNKAIRQSSESYATIRQILLDSGLSKEKANQDARYALLESCETSGVWGFTLEALINLANKRLCVRSQWEIRELTKAIVDEVIDVLPELKDKLVSQCKANLYCPESKSCGAYPTREEVKEILNEKK